MEERRADIGQRAVMGCVIRRLYFGKADRKAIGMNGSILNRIHRRGYDWPTLLRAVEGLAIRRDNGDLYGVGRMDPVSLRWLEKKTGLNEVEVCLDAEAMAGAVKAKVEPKRGGQTQTLADILNQFGKGA